jgi:hypothetical protein
LSLKASFFSQIPNEWGFDVGEKLHGRTQNVDITDELTGEPHQLARSNIPMHGTLGSTIRIASELLSQSYFLLLLVNEIGYSNVYEQNVFVKRSDDERALYYFAHLEAPLEIGTPVELLTNYSSGYEHNRERKGYGLRNLEGRIASDEHFATRLRRNFSERDHVESILDSTNSFIEGTPSSPIDAMQRLSFLLTFFHS